MKSYNEQIEQMAELQKKNMEPMLNWNAFATEAFERFARQNHAVAADWIDYSVAQAKVPNLKENPRDVYEGYITEARAYAEKLSQRSTEYVELAKELSALATKKAAA